MLTAVAADPVVAVPRPVMTVPPAPVELKAPVATVVADDATLAAVTSVAVTAVGVFAVHANDRTPSASTDAPHDAADPAVAVTFDAVTVPLVPVIEVVASLLVAPGYDFTKVAVLLTETLPPDAVAESFVVDGVTVAPKVVSAPSTLSVVCAPKPVIAAAVPFAPTATSLAVADSVMLLGVTVWVCDRVAYPERSVSVVPIISHLYELPSFHVMYSCFTFGLAPPDTGTRYSFPIVDADAVGRVDTTTIGRLRSDTMSS